MGCSYYITAESQFVVEGKQRIVSRFQKTFWPDAARIGVRTLGCSIYWRKLLESLVEDHTFESLEILRVPLVFYNDPFLRLREKLGVFADLSKKPLGAGKAEGKTTESPTDTAEIIVEKEKEEDVEEEEET